MKLASSRMIATAIGAACIALSSYAEIRKIASIKLDDDGRVEADSVAIEDSAELAQHVADALASSTNLPFAVTTRGDNSYDVSPFDLHLTQMKPDQGGGGIDPETGEYHFTVIRYWFDPDAAKDSSGYPADRIEAVLYDTTFNNRSAVAEYSIFLSGEVFATVTAPITSYSIDFGGGVIATINPIESVVYSAELDKKLDSRLLQTTNTLSNVAFTGDYRSLTNLPGFEIRAIEQDDKVTYKLFQTTPKKE